MVERDPLLCGVILGSLVLASTVGLPLGSWLWSLLVLTGLLSLAFDADEWRPDPRS